MTAHPHVGILAVQGGVAEHATALTAVGALVTLVRHPRDIIGPDGFRVDALVLPGGESSTQDKLMRMLDIADPLRELITAGVPTLGTCAGLILLANTLEAGAAGQCTLGGLDITVSRNAWGSQLSSHEIDIPVQAAGIPPLVRGAFIRAPEIVRIGEHARAIATVNGRIVGATSLARPFGTPQNSDTDAALGSVTGISFHPELTHDLSFHRALVTDALAARHITEFI